MKLTGVIRRSDLEGGAWTLEAGGETYQLSGALDAARDGLKVEVEGKVQKDMMGIGMMGPQLEVKSIKPLG